MDLLIHLQRANLLLIHTHAHTHIDTHTSIDKETDIDTDTYTDTHIDIDTPGESELSHDEPADTQT